MLLEEFMKWSRQFKVDKRACIIVSANGVMRSWIRLI